MGGRTSHQRLTKFGWSVAAGVCGTRLVTDQADEEWGEGLHDPAFGGPVRSLEKWMFTAQHNVACHLAERTETSKSEGSDTVLS
jgi:hypothetical protein